jgi:hypothetical protein
MCDLGLGGNVWVRCKCLGEMYMWRWLVSPCLAAALVAGVAGVMASGVLGSTARCRPDGRVALTRPVVKTYRDPLGDNLRGHADVTTVRISDARSVVTFEIALRQLASDGALVYFDTNCDSEPEFGLWLADTDVALEHYVNGEIHRQSPPQASVARSGATWTWKLRIPALRFGGLTAFRFNVHVDTEVQEQISDYAPDYEGWWYYDLKSR